VAHVCPHDETPAFGCSSCYAHLKFIAMRGGALTEDWSSFVGATVHCHDACGGWRPPIRAAGGGDSVQSAEDTELLRSLMNAVINDRIEFHAEMGVLARDGRRVLVVAVARAMATCGRATSWGQAA
jgi:hypothetical protein